MGGVSGAGVFGRTSPPVWRLAWVQALCDLVLPTLPAVLGGHTVTHLPGRADEDQVSPPPVPVNHGDPGYRALHCEHRCGDRAQQGHC